MANPGSLDHRWHRPSSQMEVLEGDLGHFSRQFRTCLSLPSSFGPWPSGDSSPSALSGQPACDNTWRCSSARDDRQCDGGHAVQRKLGTRVYGVIQGKEAPENRGGTKARGTSRYKSWSISLSIAIESTRKTSSGGSASKGWDHVMTAHVQRSACPSRRQVVKAASGPSPGTRGPVQCGPCTTPSASQARQASPPESPNLQRQLRFWTSARHSPMPVLAHRDPAHRPKQIHRRSRQPNTA